MKEIKGYEGLYSVTKCGKVWSHRKEIYLVQHKNSSGYFRVSLSLEGKKRFLSVHRLVAVAYLSNPENKRTVNHINGIKTDNRLVNLEWSTYSENHKHAREVGLCKQKGETHTQSKLTKKEVHEIKILLKTKITQRLIAEKFGVTRRTIGKIKTGQTWRDV